MTLRNSFVALVPDLPAPSSLGLLLSAKVVLTPTTLPPAAASSSSSDSFLSGSEGALPAVGGLDLSPGAEGVCYPASHKPLYLAVQWWEMSQSLEKEHCAIQEHEYINKLLQNILNLHQEIESIIVHVGFNDIMKGSSEQLKMDFKELIGSLLDQQIPHNIWPCALRKSWH